MRAFAIFLKVLAPVFVLVGVLHLLLGLGADALLGAKVPPEALTDPGLDSQNRFYGTAFMLYGVLLWLCSTDLAKYATVLRCVLWVFFASGLARLVSIFVYGVPPPPMVVLLLSELIGPPLILWWFSRVQQGS
jgi:Domain of unknown function (DUF4345)